MTFKSEKIDDSTNNTQLRGDGARPEDEETASSITTTDRNLEHRSRSIDIIPEQLLTPNGVPADEEAAAAAPKERAASRASSARSRPLSIVPRLERRGLLAQLTFVPEVEHPYDYPNRIKWTITVFVALAACAAPMGSAIFYRKHLDTSRYIIAAPLANKY